MVERSRKAVNEYITSSIREELQLIVADIAIEEESNGRKLNMLAIVEKFPKKITDKNEQFSIGSSR